MIALALEFSTSRRSVAVGRDGAILAEVVHEGTVRTPVFSLIDRALAQAGVAREQVSQVVVGLGPGSYTGARLAISVAQGWQLATGLATIGVNSLETLAWTVTQRTRLAVDAQRGELATVLAENGKVLEPIRLLALAEVQQRLTEGEIITGPDLDRILPGAVPAFPRATNALHLAFRQPAPVPAETLAPVYLREASFVKAPPQRVIPGLSPAG